MVGRANETTGFITLTFFVNDGQIRDFEFVVDTGFEGGGLTLPPDLVQGLQLEPMIDTTAVLADGTEVITNVYRGIVSWMERNVEVAVYALGTRPLLGTGMLAGRRLSVEFVIDGVLSVE